jgi:hypothetical protein
MEEKHRVVVASRARRPETAVKQFAFTEAMLPSNGALNEYRKRAWATFNRLTLPTTAEEAWRRTDLRTLPADSFRLPKENEYKDLPAVPKTLLKPLVAGQHGGQIVLLPGGAKADPSTVLRNLASSSPTCAPPNANTRSWSLK